MPDKLAAPDEATDGRDTRWNDHRAARHDRILRAALTAIDTSGGAIGVSSIAEAAGVPRSVVYRLFQNRDDLDEQIRARIVADLMVELRPALDARGTLRDAIRTAAQVYVDWVSEHPRLHQFLGTGSAARPITGSPVVSGTRTAIALQVSQMIEAYLAARLPASPEITGASENLAFGMVGLVDGAVNRWVASPETRGSSAELVDFLSEAVWSVLSTTASRYGLTLDPLSSVSPT